LRRFEDPNQIPDTFQKNALSGRDPEFKKYRDSIYDDMIDNPCKLFNFFVENNDILKKIDLRDYAQIVCETMDYELTVSAGTVAGIFGTALTNFVAFPYFKPGFKIKRFRGLVFVGKWLGGAMIGNRLAHLWHPLPTIIHDQTIKYNFGYEEFNWAMDIYEQAWRVGKLEELLEKRDGFDWEQLETMQGIRGR
jgi:hypothetical protein